MGLLDLMNRDKAEMKAELRAEMEKQSEREDRSRQQAEARLEQIREESRPQTVEETISGEQLEAVHTRLQALHAAQLLTDAELYSVEDTIVDCIEVLAKAPRTPATKQEVDQARTAVILSERLRADEVFARQLRRKLKLA